MPANKSYFTGSVFADNVIKNPFIISLLITVFALIIFYAINSSKMLEQNLRDKVKSGFWLLIAVTILTSVHFFAVKKYFAFNSITQNLQDSVNLISNESAATDVYDESIKKPDTINFNTLNNTSNNTLNNTSNNTSNIQPQNIQSQNTQQQNTLKLGRGETPITSYITNNSSRDNNTMTRDNHTISRLNHEIHRNNSYTQDIINGLPSTIQ
jgi:hypothetical protein